MVNSTENSSLLNPEAPEFQPNTIRETTQNGFQAIQKTIQASNLFPSGQSYSTFKTFTDFNILTGQLSSNVLDQSNYILGVESATLKLRNNDDDNNIEKIIETNDNILDRANTNIDIVCGLCKPKESISIDELKNPTNHVSSWNASPIIAKIQMGSATLIGSKNIPRPQLKFKDTIDNSNSLWVPKISDKPNNIKPLALNIIYNDEGEAVGYEHPYQVELDLYHPPAHFLEASPEPPTFPPSLDETKLTFIETEEQLDALVDHLNEVQEFAVDVEHHSYRTYQGITCLIQLTTDEGGDFIVDALAVREHLHKLNLAFTDPKKLKVFHGAEMDVLWLQRDFGVYIVGLFDTYQAAKMLKHNGLSLKHLLFTYCRVDADKKYQLADWRIRPLPEELVRYARLDTHYLLYVWRRLRADLLSAGLLLAVFEQSRLVCGLTYNKSVVCEDSHLALYVRSKKSFDTRQMAALKLLYKWRDTHARELDESTGYLLPNHMLVALAEALPREVQGVAALCCPMPPFLKQNLVPLHRLLLSCRELPTEPQLYHMPASISAMLNHQQLTSHYCFHDMSHFPDFRNNLPMSELYISPVFVAPADVRVFSPPRSPPPPTHVFELNVDAKCFIPPFERYKKYRSLAQIEEIREFKEKEAKIAAIGKGDELIKNEVLSKLKEANPQPPSETTKKNTNVELIQVEKKKRKRKMSSDNKESKLVEIETKPNENNQIMKNNKNNPKNTDKNEHLNNKDKVVKQFDYKKANYKNFFDESNNIRQKPPQHQYKMKHKKHRK